MADQTQPPPAAPPEPRRSMTSREQALVDDVIRTHREDVSWKAAFALQCEEIAALLMPEYRNTFYFGSFDWPGMKKTQLQVDSTSRVALGKFGAICDSLLTPRNMTWHGLAAREEELMKRRDIRLYCEGLTRLLFRERYMAASNFVGQNHANWLQLGAFGTGAMYCDGIDADYGDPLGLSHISVPMCQVFLRQNAQGRIVWLTRWYRMTAQQMKASFPDTMSDGARARAHAGDQFPINVLHRVCLRSDGEYDPERLDYRGMRWMSLVVDYDNTTLLREGGFHTFPYAIGRYMQVPGAVYGQSIAMDILPTLKTLNLMKRVYLKQAHRAVDPVLLTLDDGLASSLNMRPGAVNPGGMNPDGKPLIGVLPHGEIQAGIEMLAAERQIVSESFFLNLFQALADPRQQSATEVIERVSEKGQFLAPTIGRQEAEYVAPLIDRELDVLYQQGIPQRELGPMPRELRASSGGLKVVHTSPISRAARAQEAAGLVRSIESIGQLVAITGDKSPLYVFDDDEWPRGIAEIQAVPERWMAPRNKIEAKKRAAAIAAANQQQTARLPAMAAMIKARSVAQKNQMESGMPYAPPISGMQ